MSIPYSGRLFRSRHVSLRNIINEVQALNLKAVKRITVSFDPFGKNATTTRKFLQYITAPKVQISNPKCIFRTTVLSDRSEPTVLVELTPKIQEEHKIAKVKLNAGYLSVLELMQLLNKHVTTLAPVEEEIRVIKTKQGKRK